MLAIVPRLGAKFGRYSGVACDNNVVLLELACDYISALIVVCEYFQKAVCAVLGYLCLPRTQDGDGRHWRNMPLRESYI